MARRLAVLIVAIALGCGFFGRARVNVVNDTGVEIKNVVLSGRGFSERIESIGAGKTVEVRIRPHGESGIAVAFDTAERHIASPEQGYLEAHDAYRVTVKISPDLSVKVDTTVAER